MTAGVSGYEQCNGCGVCTLPCPIWQQGHDVFMTFAGRARVLQAGAGPEDLKDSIGACLLCGSCEPVCAMGIRTVDITLQLREAINSGTGKRDQPGVRSSGPAGRAVLIPDAELKSNEALLERTLGILEIGQAHDDGNDILQAFESGRIPSAGRVEAFVETLSTAGEIVVADGLFKRYIRKLVPELEVTGLGQSLLRLPAVRSGLRPTDLYIIEARSFNADFKKCLSFYSELRKQTGCMMNMDLQRIAIPTGTCCGEEFKNSFTPDTAKQINWILEGLDFDRVVAETVKDVMILRKTVTQPVVHTAELAERKTL